MKRPAFQFYPADWRKDAALQSCSVTARGVWHELLCVMHECDPYGHLVVNGKPLTHAQAARLIGAGLSEYKLAMQELALNDVYSVTAGGVMYSRRMVKDEATRLYRASFGNRGAEHGHKGASFGSMGGRPSRARGDNKTPHTTPHEGENKPPPSSSSSSSDEGVAVETQRRASNGKAKAGEISPMQSNPAAYVGESAEHFAERQAIERAELRRGNR